VSLAVLSLITQETERGKRKAKGAVRRELTVKPMNLYGSSRALVTLEYGTAVATRRKGKRTGRQVALVAAALPILHVRGQRACVLHINRWLHSSLDLLGSKRATTFCKPRLYTT